MWASQGYKKTGERICAYCPDKNKSKIWMKLALSTSNNDLTFAVAFKPLNWLQFSMWTTSPIKYLEPTSLASFHKQGHHGPHTEEFVRCVMVSNTKFSRKIRTRKRQVLFVSGAYNVGWGLYFGMASAQGEEGAVSLVEPTGHVWRCPWTVHVARGAVAPCSIPWASEIVL